MPTRLPKPRTLVLGAALALLSLGCKDDITHPRLRPTPGETSILGAMVCEVEIATGTSKCEVTRPSSGGASRVIIRDPLASELSLGTGVFTPADSMFRINAQIRNRGRNDLDYLGGDGTHVTGIDLYLHNEPEGRIGSSSYYSTEYVAPWNHDGRKYITNEDQPYWHFPVMLWIAENSQPRELQFKVQPGVTSMRLIFYISAQIPADDMGPKVVVNHYGGTQGGPMSVVYHRRVGDTIKYAFTVASGNENLQTILDGHPVPNVGWFVVDSTHYLEASADSIMVLPPVGEALVTGRRAILTATDKPAALRAYMSQVRALAASVGEEEASRIVELAEFQAIDPVTDYAALHAEDAALANHSFDIGTFTVPSTTGPAQNRATLRGAQSVTSAGTPADTTNFYFINGIMTARGDAASTAERLKILLSELPQPKSYRAEVKLFYNRTYRVQNNRERELDEYCTVDAIRSSRFLRPISRMKRWMICKTQSPLNFFIGDLWESAKQVLEIRYGMGSVAEDAALFADSITHYANKGRKVILVPHSQGNLMAQQAAAHMKETDPTWETTRPFCVGAVSLAAPLSDHWIPPFRSGDFYPVLVWGDMIYTVLQQNNFSTVFTEDSQELYDAIERTERIPNPVQRAMAQAQWKLHYGAKIHLVTESYLTRTASRNEIKTGLSRVYTALRQRCGPELRIANAPARLARGDSIMLITHFLRPNLAPLVVDGVQWSNQNPGAGTLSPLGVLTGSGGGPVQIRATWPGGEYSDSAGVLIYDRRGIAGSWSGTWNNHYTNASHIEGPASLNIPENLTQGTFSLSWRDGGYSGLIQEEGNWDLATARSAWSTFSDAREGYPWAFDMEVIRRVNGAAQSGLRWTIYPAPDAMTARGVMQVCHPAGPGYGCYYPYAYYGSVDLVRTD